MGRLEGSDLDQAGNGSQLHSQLCRTTPGLLDNVVSLGGCRHNMIRGPIIICFSCLVSVRYIFYISLQTFMTCGRIIKQFSFVSYFLFLINPQQFLSASLFCILSQYFLANSYCYGYSVGGIQLEKVVMYVKMKGVTLCWWWSLQRIGVI